MRWSSLVMLSTLLLAACSGEERARCDPQEPVSCGVGARCTAEGYCEDLAACDPADPGTCPAGFVCRPVADGAYCEPEMTAGRIPSCIDSEGMDVFAVEADSALSITWNVNNPAIDFSSGFRVRHGVATATYEDAVEVGPDAREVVLAPLENGVACFVVVEALGSGGNVSFTSCEVQATPHLLVFATDHRVNAEAAGAQQDPDLAANLDGTRLYLAWEEGDAVAFAQSTDFGDTWTEVAFTAAAAGQGAPALAVRDQVVDEAGTVVTPETVFLAWEEGGSIHLVRYLPVTGVFEAPIVVAAGASPDVAVGPGVVHLAYEDAGGIYHTGSLDEGLSFLEPMRISGDTTQAGAPSIAVGRLTGDVYVGWDAYRGGGDTDVYFSASLDDGVTFGPVVRIDDDTRGLNQLNVSITLDERSQELYATWEDRRGGANVYFALSTDYGQTWSTNIDVGAGLGGDQFRPQAVVDAAHNVYVAFQDTTNGARVVFSRFNVDGSFDPPLEPSSAAGAGGVAADRPTVATDRFGTVYMAWQENRNGPDTDIFFARAE